MKHRTKSRIAFTLAAVFIVAAVALAGIYLSMQQAARPSPGGPDASYGSKTAVDEDGFPEVDWAYWQSVNPDVIGWVTVEGTNISQPVVQAPVDDPTYYLTHDVYRNYNIYGCPYLDADCCELGFDSQNAVVFGHHMNDGSMFSAFADYSDPGFSQEHRTILLQTPDSKRILQVNFSRIVNGAQSIKRTHFDDETDYSNWYKQEMDDAVAFVGSDAVPSTNTTFVTCSYNRFSNERTLVYASLDTLFPAN